MFLPRSGPLTISSLHAEQTENREEKASSAIWIPYPGSVGTNRTSLFQFSGGCFTTAFFPDLKLRVRTNRFQDHVSNWEFVGGQSGTFIAVAKRSVGIVRSPCRCNVLSANAAIFFIPRDSARSSSLGFALAECRWRCFSTKFSYANRSLPTSPRRRLVIEVPRLTSTYTSAFSGGTGSSTNIKIRFLQAPGNKADCVLQVQASMTNPQRCPCPDRRAFAGPATKKTLRSVSKSIASRYSVSRCGGAINHSGRFPNTH